MKWKGVVRKTTPVDERQGVAHYLENPSLLIEGEMDRRDGFARSQFAKASGAILAIMPANPSNNHFTVFQVTGGSIVGEDTLPPWWGDGDNLPFTSEAPDGTATQQGGGGGPDDSDDQNYVVNDSGLDFATNFGLVSGSISGGYVAINTGGVNGQTYQVTVTWDLDWTAEGVLEGGPHDMYVEFRLAVLNGASSYDSSTGAWTGTDHTSDTETTLGTTYVLKGSYAPNQAGAGTFTVTGSGSGTAVHTMDGGATLLVYYNAYDDAYAMTDELLGMVGTVDVDVVRLSAPSDQWDIVVNRAAGTHWEDSYEIFAKDGSYPTSQNDAGASSVGTISIAADADSASDTVTAPDTNATWKFLAVPKRSGQYGTGGQLV